MKTGHQPLLNAAKYFTGCVSKQLRFGRIFNDDCITNLLMHLMVKEFRKSVGIW